MPDPTQIASYRIENILGEGGMGVVYRALDTRLNRPVAIKLLSNEVADAAARRRFQREAETASSLNHPHILTVYDAGEFEGRQYLVVEFVDGGTLKQWAQQEKRTWRQIVGLLTGVADGLAAAHNAGILHRDIKPDNVLIAKNGYAKLADFGLAKLADPPQDDLTRTLTEGRTGRGVLIGTIAYMSPEQAGGNALDARSDIFSFGVLLYEMLAGKRPFRGATDLQVLQTILHGDPEPLSEAVPVALRALVAKALEKNPAERYQTMLDMVVDLRRSLREEPRATAVKALRWRQWIPWAAAAIAISFAVWQMSRPASGFINPLANAKFTMLTNFPGVEADAAISPDGKFVTFLSDRDGPLDIWLTQAGSERFVNLTQGKWTIGRGLIWHSRFSRDGSDLWFATDPHGMHFMPLLGGSPRPFLVENAVEAAWSADGRLVYHTDADGDPMFVADRDGGNARPLFSETSGRHTHYQTWSLDGNWIYFSAGSMGNQKMDLWRIASSGGQPERLTFHDAPRTGFPTPIDSKTLLYVAEDRDGSGPWLWSFDLDARVSQRVAYGIEQYHSIDASADHRRLVATVANPGANLWVVPIQDVPSTERDVRVWEASAVRSLAPRFGGKALFYLSSQGTGDGLWRFEDGNLQEVWKGSDEALLAPAAVSADGKQIALALRRSGKRRLHVASSVGTGMKVLNEDIEVDGAASWSPDGKSIVTGGTDGKGPGLFKVPVEGGKADRLVAGNAQNPVWSPDGALIVYNGGIVSTFAPLEAIRPDGSPVRLPAIRVLQQGERFRFLPNGKGLIYMQGDTPAQDFWLLDLATMKSRRLTKFTSGDRMRTFDVAPDGRRIVFDRLRENSNLVLIDLPVPSR